VNFGNGIWTWENAAGQCTILIFCLVIIYKSKSFGKNDFNWSSVDFSIWSCSSFIFLFKLPLLPPRPLLFVGLLESPLSASFKLEFVKLELFKELFKAVKFKFESFKTLSKTDVLSFRSLALMFDFLVL
jgi:hypothetical protein